MSDLLRGSRAQCTACGTVFRSTGAFAAHRTGKATERRCLTVGEMRERGMDEVGGVWRTAAMPAAVVEARGGER